MPAKQACPNFKQGLDDFFKHTLAQKYNGQSSPRLVLFSPIAHENLHDRNLPDGTANNKRLELYTAAMAEVARVNKVLFVDLFHPTQELYAKAEKAADHQRRSSDRRRQPARRPGHRQGPVRSADRPMPQAAQLEKIRQAVLDKNFYWFNRYRTVDGYTIYGGRAALSDMQPDGQVPTATSCSARWKSSTS